MGIAFLEEHLFKSAKSRRLFEFLKDAYVKDDEVLRLPLDRCGWRSLVQIAEGTGFAPNSLYGKRPGHVGSDLQELMTDRLIEMRYFEGERGRGGEVMRFRIINPKQRAQEKDKASSADLKVPEKVATIPEISHREKEVFEQNRIAVLPFTNMSPDPNDDYFADGITDEIISTVSKLEQVEVISRTSIMQYRKNPKPIREVSKELNVGTILEGSVRKAGNRLRITAQLIDATKDRHLWAETYDRNLEDVFAVQSEVAEKVANALHVSLRKTTHADRTGNIEAYPMYLRAMQFSQEYSESSYRKAITLFESAVSQDPTFSRAYVGLANAWIMMGSWETGWADLTSSVNKAEAAAKRALELDPESAEAHTVMGRVHQAMDRFDEEHLELQRAIEINPNLASANESLGVEYAYMGRFDEAIKYVQKASYLDPLNPHPMRIMTNVLRVEGKVDEALEIVGNFMEIFPRDPLAHLQRVLCFLQKKDLSRAGEALDAGLRFYPDDYWLRIARGMTFALAGRREDAIKELQRLMTDDAESNRVGAQVWIRTALGDLDEAFEALMRGAELHAWWFLIKFDPLFEVLWKDPRFTEFCKKVGLPS